MRLASGAIADYLAEDIKAYGGSPYADVLVEAARNVDEIRKALGPQGELAILGESIDIGARANQPDTLHF